MGERSNQAMSFGQMYGHPGPRQPQYAQNPYAPGAPSAMDAPYYNPADPFYNPAPYHQSPFSPAPSVHSAEQYAARNEGAYNNYPGTPVSAYQNQDGYATMTRSAASSGHGHDGQYMNVGGDIPPSPATATTPSPPPKAVTDEFPAPPAPAVTAAARDQHMHNGSYDFPESVRGSTHGEIGASPPKKEAVGPSPLASAPAATPAPAPAAAAPGAQTRPMTVYDEADVYGGI
ncbi:hypothetical protein CYLTODRAFT_273812 [Cylindrobasidium torrendii FP15055 ss-10]|uniref:Uncharacterized protein n=1 Tax=Cylindrobasidium torrendii FP15055 ss-10 TaxID=1314674 RepID=A0A0D7BBX4_9AGAR|nr:hypothetical protein CYLTODRAFT_273812 [Cylindrobasidium torrendii FP15055 ss-10]